MGKPHDLTLKAQLKAYLGYGYPFDRHDWYVDRGGEEQHYVIDYYYCPTPGIDIAMDPNAIHTKSIHVDVRPVPDSLGDIYDRLLFFPTRMWESLQRPRFYAEGLDPKHAPQTAAAFALTAPSSPSVTSTTTATKPTDGTCPVPHKVVAEVDDELFARAGEKCGPLLARLQASASTTSTGNPNDEAERHRNHIAFNYCMASLLCPDDATKYMDALKTPASGPDGQAIETRQHEAFTKMTECVAARFAVRRDAKQKEQKLS